MSKKILNVTHREALMAHAIKQVESTEDRADFDSSYAAAAVAISALVRGKYPPSDMKVLQKYGQARTDHCVYVSTGGSNYEQFTFRADDKRAPVRPGDRCNGRTPYLLPENAQAPFDRYVAAAAARAASIKQRTADFRTLIYSARTFEELLEVWPGADELREKILGTSRALAVMSDEVVARIRADPAAQPTA